MTAEITPAADGSTSTLAASGGSAVITEALEVMHGGPPRRLTFGVSDETAWEVGLACGGKIEIFVEAVA